MQNERYLTKALEFELDRQDAKWGADRSHPDVANIYSKVKADISIFYINLSEEEAKEQVEERFNNGVGTWADILVEEVAEAMNESDPDKRIAELIQVAAVALQWANDIMSRP